MLKPANPLDAYGFLTFVDTPDAGIFGGYLALSGRGRPLEFRCSTPVEPNRAQKILFGATLRPHLITEIIGTTLLRSLKIPVSLILTDDRAALPLGSLRTEPLALVTRRGVESPQNGSPPWITIPRERDGDPPIDYGDYHFDLLGMSEHRRADLLRQIAPLTEAVDLLEPMQRIRAALAEIRQAALSDPHEFDEAPHAAA